MPALSLLAVKKSAGRASHELQRLSQSAPRALQLACMQAQSGAACGFSREGPTRGSNLDFFFIRFTTSSTQALRHAV